MGGVNRESRFRTMHSSVNWALLGLIIERPSYVYALASRFERTYGHALQLSSTSHAYTAIAALHERGLVEELPGTKGGSQPKPTFRATAKGIADYHEWLIGQVAEERRRQKVFLLQLTALARDPDKAFEVLDTYERACLADTCIRPLAPGDDRAPEDAQQLQARLLDEERRLAVGAQLEWTRFARHELKALTNARAAARGRSGPSASTPSGSGSPDSGPSGSGPPPDVPPIAS